MFQTLGKTPRLGHSTCLPSSNMSEWLHPAKEDQTTEQIGAIRAPRLPAPTVCWAVPSKLSLSLLNPLIASSHLAPTTPSSGPNHSGLLERTVSVPPYLPCHTDSSTNMPLNLFQSGVDFCLLVTKSKGQFLVLTLFLSII